MPKIGSYYRPYRWPLERLIKGTNRYLALLSSSSFSNTCPLSISEPLQNKYQCRRLKIKNMIHHESSFPCKKITAVKIKSGAIWVSLYHLMIMKSPPSIRDWQIKVHRARKLAGQRRRSFDRLLSICSCRYGHIRWCHACLQLANLKAHDY